MKKETNESSEKRDSYVSDVAKNDKIISIIGVIIFFLIVGLIFFILHRSIYSLQRLLYQRHSEFLIGSSNIIIGVLALVISAAFFIFEFSYNLASGEHPHSFLYKFFYYVNGKSKINRVFFHKVRMFFIALLILGGCIIYFFLNEYISLGSSYIAASSGSYANNRKEYKYSDIQLVEKPSKNFDNESVSIYRFSDGRELTNIGAFAGDTIKLIKNKQIGLKLNMTKVSYDDHPRNTSGLNRFIPYLVWAAAFFFAQWTIRKFLKKDK